jgi:hypothetical protein
MGHFTRSAAVAAVFVCLFLTACGTGRTMVMEPVTERKVFDAARLERADDSVAVPEELRTMFREQLRKELYGTPEKAGPFTEGDGLTIRVRVIQFEGGSQFQRWFWGGIGNQGEASMQLLTEFFDGEKKLANIQTEGRIGSGFFGGSVKSAVEKATSEISSYAMQNFADPARAAAFLGK